MARDADVTELKELYDTAKKLLATITKITEESSRNSDYTSKTEGSYTRMVGLYQDLDAVETRTAKARLKFANERLAIIEREYQEADAARQKELETQAIQLRGLKNRAAAELESHKTTARESNERLKIEDELLKRRKANLQAALDSGLSAEEAAKTAETIYQEQSALADKETGTTLDQAKSAQFLGGKLDSLIRKVDDGNTLAKAAGIALRQMAGAVDGQIKAAVNTISQNQAKANTRLMGTGKTFENLLKQTTTTLAGSNIVKMDTMISNLNSMIDQGIVYNLEQRAFLASISENVSSTFRATAELNRLIRLQQADSTQARMGLSALLNETLAGVFKDSSYMNSMYDTISAAILDTETQLSTSQAVEFEYIVQKWLGSLYSVGASESALNKIAQGINYLGTGNISALTGDSTLNTLLALSAGRANLEYSQILTDGLTSEKTNKLMKSMVEYLKEISAEENKVLKTQYANLFGIGISDLSSFGNLTQTDIDNIFLDTRSAGQLQQKLSDNIKTIYNRMSLITQVQNIKSNLLYGTGLDFANDPISYFLYDLTSMLGDLKVGGTVELNPFGVGISGNIFDLMKEGMAITEPSNSNSYSGYVGGASNSDIEKTTLSDQANKQAENKEVVQQTSTDKTFNDLYEALFGTSDRKYVDVNIVRIGDSPLMDNLPVTVTNIQDISNYDR